MWFLLGFFLFACLFSLNEHICWVNLWLCQCLWPCQLTVFPLSLIFTVVWMSASDTRNPSAETKWGFGICTNHICIAILFPSLKSRVEEALKGSQVPTAKDFRKFSQNYQISKRVSVPGVDPISAKVEGNVVFDPNSYVPKETMLKTTLNVYGFGPSDIFEVQQLSKTLLVFSCFLSHFCFLITTFSE